MIEFTPQQFVTVTCERLRIPIASVQTDESATGPSTTCDANGCTITLVMRSGSVLSDLVHEISHCLENSRVQEMLRSGTLKEGDTIEHHSEIFRRALCEIVKMIYSDPLSAHDWSREEWLEGDPAEFLKGCTGDE